MQPSRQGRGLAAILLQLLGDSDGLGIVGDERGDVRAGLRQDEVIGLGAGSLHDDVPGEVRVILRSQHLSLLDIGVEFADSVHHLPQFLGAGLVLGEGQGEIEFLIEDIAPLGLGDHAVKLRNFLRQGILAADHLVGELLDRRILRPDLGGALERTLGLGGIPREGRLLRGEDRHVGGVDGVVDLRENGGPGEIAGAAPDLVHIALHVGKVMLITEPLQLAEVAPKFQHLTLLGLLVHHDRRLEFAEEVGLLQSLEGAVELALLDEVIHGTHPDGDVVHGLPREGVEGFERRHKIGNREELLHFLGPDLDALVAALEQHPVEGAGDDAVAVAAGQEETDHLRLELDLGLQAERGHLGVLSQDFGLRALLVLDAIAELGGAPARFRQLGGAALRTPLGGALVIGGLDLVRPVHDDPFLGFADRLQLILRHLELAEFGAHVPDLLDLGGDGQAIITVDLVFGRLEEQVKGLLLVGEVVGSVDRVGRQQALDATEQILILQHVTAGGGCRQVALEAHPHRPGVAEVESLPLPLHRTVLHVDRVAVDIEQPIRATLGGRALVIPAATTGDGRARRRRLGEPLGDQRAPTETNEERCTHGGKIRNARGLRPGVGHG